MPATLGDLLKEFGIPSSDGVEKTAAAAEPSAPTDADANRLAALLQGGGTNKTASDGGTKMGLQDIWMRLNAADADMDKTASAATSTATTEEPAAETTGEAPLTGSTELDKVAEAAAVDELGIEKQAAELDAAGRIMARGYFDELQKLAAAAMSTHVKPNAIEPGSQDKQTPMGPRGTEFQLKTNYAGTHGKHDQPISTAGSKAANKDALKDGKSTTVGSGITEKPPVVGGFATVKDIMG